MPLPIQFGGKCRRGGISKRGVRSPGIIIIGPCSDVLAGMPRAQEQRFIGQFVTHPSVDALDEGVLGWVFPALCRALCNATQLEPRRTRPSPR